MVNTLAVSLELNIQRGRLGGFSKSVIGRQGEGKNDQIR